MQFRLVARVVVPILLVTLTSLLTATPASATEVSSESELRAAFADPAGGEIRLDNDVTLTDCSPAGGDLDRVDGEGYVLVGRGFTIEQTCDGERVVDLQGTTFGAIRDITITGGEATGNGGGISIQDGGLQISNGLVIGNNASGSGGGIDAGSVDLDLQHTTVSGNRAAGVGAVGTTGDLNLANSTISDNESATSTGGLDAAGYLGIGFSTVVGNRGPVAANVAADRNGYLAVYGSILALPRDGGPNCKVSVTTVSGMSFSDDASCGLIGLGDSQNAGSPLLAPLADNGGSTPTRMPQPGSPVIDRMAGAACALANNGTDQRGVVRPIGPACDIGSVEAPLPVVEPTTTSTTWPVPASTAPRFTG